MTGFPESSGQDDTALPEIEMIRVSKRFGRTLALDKVDLTIGRGEVHALVGHNGSGKSTLIKILAGYHTAEPGAEITIGGERMEPGRPVPQSGLNVRFVHQGLGLVDEMDAIDNIALAGGYRRTVMHRIRWGEQEQVTRELLSRLGLDFDIKKPAGDCGAVERTGIAIARALAGSTPGRGLLVLDEPSVALANSDIERLFGIVRGLAASGVSILYVSHFLDEVFAICDRVTVLRDGRVIDSAPVSSYDKRRLVEAMVGQAIDYTKRSEQSRRSIQTQSVMTVERLAGGELTHLDLKVAPGEIVGVAGSTGSGRTELPLLLVGAIPRTSGNVTLDGRAAPGRTSPKVMRDHGLVLVPADRHRQGAHLDMTVAENMTLADLRPFKGPARWLRRSEERAFIARASEDLDLRPRDPDAVFGNLSGGNQQKVVLAKWLAVEPKVLVLDEPTSGVDIAARGMIYDAVRIQAERGLGVLVCSADVEELVQLCHRIVVLRQGRVVAQFGGANCSAVEIIHALEGGTVSTERVG